MSEYNYINSGQSLQDRKLIQDLEVQKESVELKPLGIKMPVEKGTKSYETLLKMNTSVSDQVSNNLKTFILTKKGELLCKPDFGTNIHEIYNRTDLELEDIENIVMKSLSEGVARYFPFITLVDFESKEVKDNNPDAENYFKVRVGYVINNTEESNSLELKIRRSI
jgi:hypothetical protein